MEDIEILEDFIKYYEAEAISRKRGRFLSINVDECDIQAIENLIKGYRKLEEELKREKIWRIRLEKENEDTCNEVNNNYIRKSLVVPKSKIKEKIEKLKTIQEDYKKNYVGINKDYYFDLGKVTGEIQALQELMED